MSLSINYHLGIGCNLPFLLMAPFTKRTKTHVWELIKINSCIYWSACNIRAWFSYKHRYYTKFQYTNHASIITRLPHGPMSFPQIIFFHLFLMFSWLLGWSSLINIGCDIGTAVGIRYMVKLKPYLMFIH